MKLPILLCLLFISSSYATCMDTCDTSYGTCYDNTEVSGCTSDADCCPTTSTACTDTCDTYMGTCAENTEVSGCTSDADCCPTACTDTCDTYGGTCNDNTDKSCTSDADCCPTAPTACTDTCDTYMGTCAENTEVLMCTSNADCCSTGCTDTCDTYMGTCAENTEVFVCTSNADCCAVCDTTARPVADPPIYGAARQSQPYGDEHMNMICKKDFDNDNSCTVCPDGKTRCLYDSDCSVCLDADDAGKRYCANSPNTVECTNDYDCFGYTSGYIQNIYFGADASTSIYYGLECSQNICTDGMTICAHDNDCYICQSSGVCGVYADVCDPNDEGLPTCTPLCLDPVDTTGYSNVVTDRRANTGLSDTPFMYWSYDNADFACAEGYSGIPEAECNKGQPLVLSGCDVAEVPFSGPDWADGDDGSVGDAGSHSTQDRFRIVIDGVEKTTGTLGIFEGETIIHRLTDSNLVVNQMLLTNIYSIDTNVDWNVWDTQFKTGEDTDDPNGNKFTLKFWDGTTEITLSPEYEYNNDGNVAFITFTNPTFCTEPSTTGYVFTSATGSLAKGSFSRTGISCASGYSGEVTINECTEAGQPYSVSGCVEVTECTTPTTAGYVFTSATGSLAKGSFSRTGISCASGYSGEVTINECTEAGQPYSVSGCVEVPTCGTGVATHDCLCNGARRLRRRLSTATCVSGETCHSDGTCSVPVCTTPSTTGYDFTTATGSPAKGSFSITISCASGYYGIPTASECNEAGQPYSVMGCQILNQCSEVFQIGGGNSCSCNGDVISSGYCHGTYYSNNPKCDGETRPCSCSSGNECVSGETCHSDGTCSVVVVPVHCEGEFGGYGACSDGKKSRQYDVTISASNGGDDCDHPDEYIDEQVCIGLIGDQCSDNVHCDSDYCDSNSCAEAPGASGSCNPGHELVGDACSKCKVGRHSNGLQACSKWADRYFAGKSKKTSAVDMRALIEEQKANLDIGNRRRNVRDMLKWMKNEIIGLSRKVRLKKDTLSFSAAFSQRLTSRGNDVDVFVPKTKTKITTAQACDEADVDVSSQTVPYEISQDEGETALVCKGSTPITKLLMERDGEVHDEENDVYKYACWNGAGWDADVQVADGGSYTCGTQKFFVNSLSGVTCDATDPVSSADSNVDVGTDNCGTIAEGEVCTDYTCNANFVSQSGPSCTVDGYQPAVCECPVGHVEDGAACQAATISKPVAWGAQVGGTLNMPFYIQVIIDDVEQLTGVVGVFNANDELIGSTDEIKDDVSPTEGFVDDYQGNDFVGKNVFYLGAAASTNGGALTFKFSTDGTNSFDISAPTAITYADGTDDDLSPAWDYYPMVDAVTQTITYNTGWTWISFGVEKQTKAISTIFDSMNGGEKFECQGNIGSSQYIKDYGWYPDMDFPDYHMCKVKLGDDKTVSVKGKVTSVTYDLTLAWTWVGVPGLEDINLSTFLPGNFEQGDKVECQGNIGSSQYIKDYGWYPDMSLPLLAAKGCKLKKTTLGTFTQSL